MKPIKFDFVVGTLTIQWVPQEVRIAKIRTHIDENRMPGPTRYTALIEHYPKEKLYELTMLNKSKDSMAGPSLYEHSWVRDYMYRNFGALGLWRRAKRGGIKIVAKGNRAQDETNMEDVKMGLKKFRVTAQVIDQQTGAVDSTAFVEQENQTSLGICDLQDTLADTYVAALRTKGREFAQAKADKEVAAA